MNKTNLSDYIKARQIDFKNLEEELSFLEKIDLPLSITITYNDTKEIKLYSEDYTLATDVKLEKDANHIGGESYPDGGYHTVNNRIYPQFYFILENKFQNKVLPVIIRHKGFETDNNMILYSYNKTDAWGDYKDMNGQRTKNQVNKNKAYEYLENLGVKKEAIEILKEKVDEYYKMII